MNILVIEDDAILSKNIIEALKVENIHATGVFDGLLAEKLLKKERFDCVVMDVNLPGKNGFDLCRDFRLYDSQTPVLMLTAFSELDDKVRGFDCGADDYLTKPFYMRELVLRVNSLARRTRKATTESSSLMAGDITIQLQAKKVFRQGVEIQLTPREYQILLRLCERKGEIVSKKDLVREIWGRSVDTNTNTIEVYVNFLRNKVDKPFNKSVIKTKVGYGYYIETE